VLDALLIIVGPTGSGKTEVALKLVNSIKGEIISADSRQIYRGMDIGTDKVSAEIRKEVPHHLIDVADPEQVFTVFDFKKKAEKIIRDLQRENLLPVVVGGTGLYIKAIVDGIFPGPSANWKLRQELLQQAKIEGIDVLYRELRQVDPEAASRIHPHDERRIIRALEVYKLTRVPISWHQRDKTFGYKGKMVMVGLKWKRPTLYRIIEERVDRMIEKGLVEEVKALTERGCDDSLPSMQGLGYRQILRYLKGEISLDEAIQLIKRDTRRFSKRQLTWFKKERRIIWLQREDFPSSEKCADKIIEILLKEIPQTQKILKR